ncbi:MAG: signal recognition particle-docking protein FtsY [Thermoplasmata archaeon]|nr:signal recognition particle-docking protein FtsY [Thermoplasmata archaeon]
MWAAIKAKLRRSAAPDASSSAPSPSGETAPQNRDPSKPAPPAPDPSGAESHFTEGFLGSRIKDATLDEVLDDLELVLLQSDVALPVVEKVRKDLRKRLAGRKLKWGTDVEAAVRESLEESVRSILGQPSADLLTTVRTHSPKPYIILFVGVNGTGKTTTVAKMAGWMRDSGLKVVIAAGDTFRAGAIEQLLVHGERLGIKVVRQQEGSDPAAVSFDAVAHARAKGLDVVLVDTAGRQHTNENLIAEAKKIRRVVQPHLTLFVGDALSGNDVVEQARLFQEALGVDGLILTKLDADAKGGAALSATFVTKRPILFVGVGQSYADFRAFDPDWMVQRLFAEGAAA